MFQHFFPVSKLLEITIREKSLRNVRGKVISLREINRFSSKVSRLIKIEFERFVSRNSNEFELIEFGWSLEYFKKLPHNASSQRNGRFGIWERREFYLKFVRGRPLLITWKLFFVSLLKSSYNRRIIREKGRERKI